MSTGMCTRCAPSTTGPFASFRSVSREGQKRERCRACGGVFWLWNGYEPRRYVRLAALLIAEHEHARRDQRRREALSLIEATTAALRSM